MKKQLLELKGREEFICLGSECPRDCCHGWDKIEIDANTIEKWEAMQDCTEKQFLMSLINTSDHNVSVLNKTKEKVCTALNDNKLCGIQLRFGHDYLSEICRSFPRLSFQNYYRNYKSASFSCPVIVENILFDSESTALFSISEIDEQNDQESTKHDKLLYALDNFLSDILEKSEYPICIVLFFVSDMFVNIFKMIQSGDLTDVILQQLHENIDTYLADISKAVKHGKLKPTPVTSGSFWKSIYELCETHNVNKRFLDEDSSNFNRSIKQCDNSFSDYSKIYANIIRYRKKANKQIKQQYLPLFRKYIKIIFINKGFPLEPKYKADLVLVDCMINICVLQLLIWIEINKNGKLTNEFIKDCVVEVDRKFVLHDGVIKGLEENPHMIHIEKYCNSFLDLF